MESEGELEVWEFFYKIINNYFVDVFKSMRNMNIFDVFANLWIVLLFSITVKA